MKHVLMIAYYFPPDGGAGTQRPAKFVRYLPGFDWQPLVIAPAHRSGSPQDHAMLAQECAGVSIRRVAPADEPRGWVRSLPDIDIARNWLEPAFSEAERVIQAENADLAFITMSPFDLSLLGMQLTRQLSIPVVLDLRDPWALDGWRGYRGRGAWLRDREVMAAALQSAAGVVMNTPESLRAVQKEFGVLPGVRMTVIPNGYDAADLEVKRLPDDAPAADTFCLVHTGTLHTRLVDRYEGPLGWLRKARHFRVEPIEPSGRTEIHLYEAINLLRRENHPLLSNMQIVFVGPRGPENERRAAAAGLSSMVRFTGYLPHEQSLAWVNRADALFLPLHGLPAGRRSLIVPGKTYEYLASGKPILGCLPEGDARDLVSWTERGYIASPCDPVSIAAALRRMYAARSQSRNPAANESWIGSYERRYLTAVLASFFDEVLEGRAGTPKRVAARSEAMA